MTTFPEKFSDLGVPVLVITYFCLSRGHTFASFIPFAVGAAFVVVQKTAQFFWLTPATNSLAKSGGPNAALAMSAAINGLMALGMCLAYEMVRAA